MGSSLEYRSHLPIASCLPVVFILIKKMVTKPDMVEHTCILATQETEAEGSELQACPVKLSETKS